jgi:hypothetical protein
MRPSRLLALLPVVALPIALTVTGLASPASAERGEPGTWTKITTGEVSNIVEPGLYRTADGVLHVSYQRDNASDDDLAYVNISPTTGKVVAAGDILTGWASLPTDPKIVAGPDGGMRLVFGGIIGQTGNPFNSGQMFSTTSDAAGTSWTLQSTPLSQSTYGYASYGTGATTLSDGTPVVSFPVNTGLTWSVAGVDSEYDAPGCCLYNSTLARDGDDVWVAYYSNATAAADQGVFVKQLLPVEGAPIKAPQSTSGGDSLNLSAAEPFVARPGGGLYATYCLGYPTCKQLGLWKLGTDKPVGVPGSAGAQEYAMSTGPGGRIWVAWAVGDTDLVRVTHTGTSGTKFGAVTTIKPPKGTVVYGITVAGSDGSADVIINNGSALLHQQVLPGLTLKASPNHWKTGAKQKVTFTVTDTGDDVAGAKVGAAGESCTTNGSGTCSITFAPIAKKKTILASARLAGYGAGKVELKVK